MSVPSARRVVWRVRIGEKTLRFWRGNYSRRLVVPFRERYPFGCWMLSWRWGRLGWSLTRWD